MKKTIEKHKVLKINKPVPQAIKKAIEDKKEYMRKIQSGEIKYDKRKVIRTIEFN